jgi:predicted O-methyltransferase YrrM
MREDSGISIVHRQALSGVVRKLKPDLAIEIGMANGVSTRAILSAIGGGKLISIDPYQSTQWGSEGIKAVADMASSHQLIELPDYLALPQLLASSTRIDFAYVDGWHTFDYVLVDFFYLDKMLRVGGVVGFNDCGMAATHKVLKFVTRHRKYVEMPVLPPTYVARNLVVSLARRVLNRQTQDRYFRKAENWEPDWTFFSRF